MWSQRFLDSTLLSSLSRAPYPVSLLYYFFRSLALTKRFEPQGAPTAPRVFPKRSFLPDFIVVGAGAGGMASANRLIEGGAKVLMLEAGQANPSVDWAKSPFSETQKAFKRMGRQATEPSSFLGPRFPLLQGEGVGGTTQVYGGILNRVEKSVFEKWQIPVTFDAFEKSQAWMESTLAVKTTWASELASHALRESLTQKGRCRPMPCASRRCEAALLPIDSPHFSLSSSQSVHSVLVEQGRAVGVRTEAGQELMARSGVFLCAGAVETPAILFRSGYQHPELGKKFGVHWSGSVLMQWGEDREVVEGPAQGIEWQVPNSEVKFATQALPPELLLLRTKTSGKALDQWIAERSTLSSWMLSRASGQGEIRFRQGKPKVVLLPSEQELRSLQTGMQILSEAMLGAGARWVLPGLFGASPLKNTELDHFFAKPWPLDKWFLGAGHLYGGAAIWGQNGFELPGIRHLFAMDASRLPSSPGTNPALAILSLARVAADQALLGDIG